MPLLSAIVLLSILFVLEIVYFSIATHHNIRDKPNHRSSHSSITIRGGGIIFGVSSLLFFFIYDYQYIFFISGLFLITTISLLDDIHTLNNKVRLIVHFISVLLMFYQWHLFLLSWYWIPIALIFVIGTVNAYNFMDGINGLTGSYSLLAIVTLYYINTHIIPFTSTELLIITGLSLLVFNFFNFRKKAKCFAGDVGSVSIAFIIIFLIGQLILKTQNFAYVLLLFIYGLDTVVTIGFRLIRKENIFEAHRTHFYQFLANEKKWPHLFVATLFFLAQFIINIILVFWTGSSLFYSLVLAISLTLLFTTIRFATEGKIKLLGNRKP